MKNKEQRSETLKEGITTEEGTDEQAWVRLKVQFRCFKHLIWCFGDIFVRHKAVILQSFTGKREL